jgi:hypothetical protein
LTIPIPHFDLPFRFGTKGENAAVVLQDTVEDVRNCVEAVIRTQSQTREFVPTFGIEDPTFQIQPVDTNTIEQSVTTNEPRSHMVFTSVADEVDNMINHITAEVKNS